MVTALEDKLMYGIHSGRKQAQHLPCRQIRLCTVDRNHFNLLPYLNKSPKALRRSPEYKVTRSNNSGLISRP